jgi:DeoR family transcriptional regulator, aga operon transcriptional repressor
MMEVATRIVFAADSSKFGRRAFATVCQIEAADFILTDASLAPEMRQAYGDRLCCA